MNIAQDISFLTYFNISRCIFNVDNEMLTYAIFMLSVEKCSTDLLTGQICEHKHTNRPFVFMDKNNNNMQAKTKVFH